VRLGVREGGQVRVKDLRDIGQALGKRVWGVCRKIRRKGLPDWCADAGEVIKTVVSGSEEFQGGGKEVGYD